MVEVDCSINLHSENARVMVLGATNCPAELDEAILRRFSQVFEIGKPDFDDREKILRVILKNENVEDTIDLYHIARLCEGYTGSDLLELCKQAAYVPLRDFLNEEKANKTRPRPRLLSQ
ncbi:ATPase family AAA domain-containing protein 1-B-like [Hibiscus syriacus]|uniref:ATPase family AAA domain-containing protein 1-B-like n=1 Tax=Hibiscus syriacus TaxID=106335 RepID=UPI00192234DD|nr:ATPase family AAA domain-containing protein 1-B-like [Hibiscus syriacus]